MATALYSHAAAAQHQTPMGHPEQVSRFHHVMAALQDARLIHREAPVAAIDDVLRCHPRSYLDRLQNLSPQAGVAALDADTHMSPRSLDAALRAVGAACHAVDAVLAGEIDNAFVAMRPPGHHAERETAMGFCLLGTVAIAAMRAIEHHGLQNVAVLDFDVHHGNGTQDLLWHEPHVFFASTHQMPLFPGSGAASETGSYGQVMNIPLAPGSDGQLAQRAWDAILRRCRDTAPQLVLVSAGFDAHAADPLAQLEWHEEDFALLTRAICDMAAECGAPVVSSLEGGYDLPALGRSVRAHVDVLMEAGK
ncbi:histone deacetylase family protein [Paracoccus sp. Z330]|uniref:Histone deacetylase family protein n=1 Tax=Paracoccus onchidii TaxID=3017813 RepID=A0ABT4ZHF1_9RHOB|nr:histone deacetylase family protein [Paracoccus onchidii]MDB6178737.1 histone deacetylase family protein [Paracoccus onchidii]